MQQTMNRPTDGSESAVAVVNSAEVARSAAWSAGVRSSAIQFSIWSNPGHRCPVGYSQSRERFLGGFRELEFLVAYAQADEAEMALAHARAIGAEVIDTRAKVQS